MSTVIATPITPETPNSLQHLLDLIQAKWPEEEQMPMLRRTADLIAELLQRPKQEIAIAELLKLSNPLKRFLEGRRFKRNSVRSYRNYLRILVQKAEALGWAPEISKAEVSWKEFLADIPTTRDNRPIRWVARFAIEINRDPGEFSDKDLDDWGIQAIERGLKYRTVRNSKWIFRRQIQKRNLKDQFPRLSLPKERNYGTPLSELPSALRGEIQALISWKTAEFILDRPIRLKHREVSALCLLGVIRRLYGFGLLRTTIDSGALTTSIATMAGLFSRKHVGSWVEWCLNTRRLRPRTVRTCLALIYGAARAYPALSGEDFSWLPKLLAQLPDEPEDLTRDAKAKKWVDYDRLCQTPEKILVAARRRFGEGSYGLALAYHDALLMSFLTTLAWRQRNVRECRISTAAPGPNLSKGEIGCHPTLAKSPWVEEALRTNPREQFWQVYFRPRETKNGRSIRHLLPKQLVPLLEEYLTKYRPLILNGDDPGTHFLSRCGTSLSQPGIKDLVSDLTVEHTGVRVNPHLFRDILAVKFLEENSEDYLTLSKILWHRTVEVTLSCYGRNFDESHGARRVEQWLQRRKPPFSGS